jgi:hypothetical protein
VRRMLRRLLDSLGQTHAEAEVTGQGCIRQMQPKANKDKREARFDP